MKSKIIGCGTKKDKPFPKVMKIFRGGNIGTLVGFSKWGVGVVIYDFVGTSGLFEYSNTWNMDCFEDIDDVTVNFGDIDKKLQIIKTENSEYYTYGELMEMHINVWVTMYEIVKRYTNDKDSFYIHYPNISRLKIAAIKTCLGSEYLDLSQYCFGCEDTAGVKCYKCFLHLECRWENSFHKKLLNCFIEQTDDKRRHMLHLIRGIINCGYSDYFYKNIGDANKFSTIKRKTSKIKKD